MELRNSRRRPQRGLLARLLHRPPQRRLRRRTQHRAREPRYRSRRRDNQFGHPPTPCNDAIDLTAGSERDEAFHHKTKSGSQDQPTARYARREPVICQKIFDVPVRTPSRSELPPLSGAADDRCSTIIGMKRKKLAPTPNHRPRRRSWHRTFRSARRRATSINVRRHRARVGIRRLRSEICSAAPPPRTAHATTPTAQPKTATGA